MTATDRLALRWQFESFTKEFQNKCWKQMIDEHVSAWKWKKNREFIRKRICQMADYRSDLPIVKTFRDNLKRPGEWCCDWSDYDECKKKKDVYVYIGPERWMCM